MSETLKTLLEATAPTLKAQFESLGSDYLAGLENTLGDVTDVIRPVIQGHLNQAAMYRLQALSEGDEETRRALVSGAAKEVASARTVLVTHAVAVSEEQAATFAAGFEKVLDAVGAAAKGVLTSVGSALVSGAIAGLTGGDGGSLDLSGIFPGA